MRRGSRKIQSRRALIDEAAIGVLVAAFLARIRRDPVLAPVFENAIGHTEAEQVGHFERLQGFWSSILLTGEDHHHPFTSPLRLCDLEIVMFEPWLTLLRATCLDLFEPGIATAAIEKAEHAARGLRAGLFECSAGDIEPAPTENARPPVRKQ